MMKETWGGTRAVALASALLLAGCAHKPHDLQIRMVEVQVPIPVPCKAEVDVRDSYADDVADQASDIFEKVKALLIGREERKEDAAKLKGAVVGCGGSVK